LKARRAFSLQTPRNFLPTKKPFPSLADSNNTEPLSVKQPQRNSKGKLVKKIFVGNFSFSTTEADLRQWFAPFGSVDSASVVTDRDTGRSRGFGFVEMPNNAEAEAAIAALNGKDTGGRPLTVNEARPKTQSSGGFRGGRGGGGGGRDDYLGHARQPREPRW
jgi:cold-inducible RNA-binding protein